MNKIDLQIPKQAATLRLLVEEKLRTAIATGHFRPGQRLIERELCEQTGVGRTSIREALRQLEAEGLVTTIPHRGPTVTSVTYEEAEQLYDIRAMLESFAGRKFAESRDVSKFKALGEAVDRFEKAAKGANRAELLEAKTHFYDVMMDGSGNVFVKQMLTLLHNRISLLRFTSMTQPGRLKKSVAEIRDIFDAISAHDGRRAAEACALHVEEAAKIALAVLKTSAG